MGRMDRLYLTSISDQMSLHISFIPSTSRQSHLQPFPIQGTTTVAIMLPLSLFLFLFSDLILVRSSFSATSISNPVGHPRLSWAIKPPIRSPSPRPLSGFEQHKTTSQNATMTSFANASHPQTSSAAPTQTTGASQRGAGDPCGPRGEQTDFESTLNTCGQINTTYTDAPSRYGVQCLNANPSLNQSINTLACSSNINHLCRAITDATVVASQWNWSSGVCIHFLLFLLLLAYRQPRKHNEKRRLTRMPT